MMKSNRQRPEENNEPHPKIARPKLSLIGRAINYLSIREYSQLELRKKLTPHAESEDAINEVIKKLVDKGYLSNERFVESFVTRRSQKYGIRRISQELQQHQLPPELIKEELDKVKLSEPAKCYEIWEKKFGILTADPKEFAKQVRYLANKGFSQEIIMKVVRGKLPIG